MDTKSEIKSISLREIMDGKAGDNGAVIVLFTLANIIFVPSIPFLPLMFGIPVIVILISFMTGVVIPLPGFLAERSVKIKNLNRFLNAGRKISFMASQNRMIGIITGDYSMIFICTMGILLTLATCTPLPIFNIPSAFCMLFIAMGLAKNDGLLSITGAVMGLPALIFLCAGPLIIVHSQIWKEIVP